MKLQYWLKCWQASPVNMCLLAGVIGMAPVAATAQTVGGVPAGPSDTAPAAPGAAASPASGGLEEIVVTAQKRSENLQRVPIAITALTSGMLARANITSTLSLQQVTPGLTTTTSLRSALPFIRGVGSTDAGVGVENPVALYIDGVYIESSQAASSGLNNIERIEVLKGPQGTLFGRNATGGLISIITKTPSRQFGANLEVGYGNYQTFRSTLYVTGPLNDKVAADLALVYSDQNQGWGHNLLTGRKIDTDRSFSARSKILIDLNSTRITLAGDYSHQRTDIGSERNLVPGATGLQNTPHRGGFYDSQSDIYPTGILRQAGGSVRIEHDLSFAKLTSISSYRDTRFTGAIDQDETPLVFFDSFFTGIHFKTATQELQLASNRHGSFDWIVGGFFMHRNAGQPNNYLVGAAFANPPFFGAGVLSSGVKTDTGAPFGQVTWHLTPTTNLTGGIRYTLEHQHFQGTQAGNHGVFLSVDKAVTYRKATFRAAIDHNFTNDVMVYASFNRGFKGGAYSVSSLAAPPAGPEQLDAYEVGFKSDLLDRHLRINGSAFYYDYRNIQLNISPPPGSGALATTINAAHARIVGADGQIEVVPVAGLKLTAGASYLPTAKYLSFPNAPLYTPKAGGGNTISGFDASGHRMFRAAELTGNLSADYSVKTGAGVFDAGVNLYHSSSFAFLVDARYRQPSYELLSGQISLAVANSGLTVSAWINNALGRHYYSTLSETTSSDAYGPAAPRTFGVKLAYRL